MQGDNLAADGFGVNDSDAAKGPQIDIFAIGFGFNNLPSKLPAQNVVAFPAHAKNFNRLALGLKREGAVARKPRDRRIESAAKSPLCSADEEQRGGGWPAAVEERGDASGCPDEGSQIC